MGKFELDDPRQQAVKAREALRLIERHGAQPGTDSAAMVGKATRVGALALAPAMGGLATQLRRSTASVQIDVTNLEVANRSGDLSRALQALGSVKRFVAQAPAWLGSLPRGADAELEALVHAVMTRAVAAIEDAPKLSRPAIDAARRGDFAQWDAEVAPWRAARAANEDSTSRTPTRLARGSAPNLDSEPGPSPSSEATASLGEDGEHHEDQVAKRGITGAGVDLPHLATIQKAFGVHDVSSVRAHIGGAAAAASDALGAMAFAYGDAIAFASAPDLHTAAHEAAHVVQQRRGVSRTSGVDDVYEHHADLVADKVVRGESAEALLSAVTRSGSTAAVVQRKTAYGVARHGKATSGKAEALTLPDGVNLQILADGAIVLRRAWVDSDPDKQPKEDGVLVPNRMAEILKHLQATGFLSPIEPTRVEELTRQIGILGPGGDSEFFKLEVAFNVYSVVGPPPNSDVIFTKDGNGLAGMVRQSRLIPTPVPGEVRVALSPEVRATIFATLEAYTNLPIPAQTRAILTHQDFQWSLVVSSDRKGVVFYLNENDLVAVYGQQTWASYLANPPKPSTRNGIGAGERRSSTTCPRRTARSSRSGSSSCSVSHVNLRPPPPSLSRRSWSQSCATSIRARTATRSLPS